MRLAKALRSKAWFWVLVWSLAMALPLRAGPMDDAFLAIPTGNINRGYGICLFDAKGEIWSGFEGLAQEEPAVPFARDTVFRVGAVSDLFTVMLALRLADRGLVDPRRPVAAYLPDLFAGAAPDSPLGRVGALPLGLLMSHLSGTNATFFLGYQDYDPFVNLQDYLKDVNLKYPPDTKVVRSGAMIDLLGRALVRVGGKGFDELVRTELFEPLGMRDSSFRYQDSPRFASLRYKSAAPNSYATRVWGFREVVAPSGSMQSSLQDLVRAYSALLRGPADAGACPLSRPAVDSMFSPRNAAVAQRQGLSTGYGWKLSMPELAYLGPVAWYYGKHFSHRNVVILLPGLGLGAVCATNAWSILDWETILPMTVAVIKAYARAHLGIPEPAPQVPKQVPMPSGLAAQVAGLYVSPFGVYRVQAEPDGIRVTSDALDALLVHGGQNAFQAAPGGPLDQVVFFPPDALGLHLHNGIVLEAQRSRPDPGANAWLQRLGTYRIVKAKAGAMYAFTLSAAEGLPVVSGDDGLELPLEVRSADWATITCDASSQFFGKDLRLVGGQGLRMDGVLYHPM